MGWHVANGVKRKTKHCAAHANKDLPGLTEHLANLERMALLGKAPAPRVHREPMPNCTTECYLCRLNVHVKRHLGPRGLPDLPAMMVSPVDQEEMEKTEPRVQLVRQVQWDRQDSRDHRVNEVLLENPDS